MSDFFELESTPGHVDVAFKDSVEVSLEALRQQAEAAGAGRSAPFGPEVEYLCEVITELRRELPAAIRKAGWPKALESGDKLDDFILMLLKDPARAARGRGTTASAKLGLAGLDVQ